MRRENLEAVRTVMEMNIEGKRGRRRPKKKWLDAIECDVRIAGVCVDDVENRVKWKWPTSNS